MSHAGLSKSLGLIEGFGGRGKGGLPATLSPAEESDAKDLREKYGYNAYLSDRISLDRTIPDYRPGKCVHQLINRDPEHLTRALSTLLMPSMAA